MGLETLVIRLLSPRQETRDKLETRAAPNGKKQINLCVSLPRLKRNVLPFRPIETPQKVPSNTLPLKMNGWRGWISAVDIGGPVVPSAANYNIPSAPPWAGRRRSLPGTARDFLPNWGPGLRSFPSTPPAPGREKLFLSVHDFISIAPGCGLLWERSWKTRGYSTSIASRFLLRRARRMSRRIYRVVWSIESDRAARVDRLEYQKCVEIVKGTFRTEKTLSFFSVFQLEQARGSLFLFKLSSDTPYISLANLPPFTASVTSVT